MFSTEKRSFQQFFPQKSQKFNSEINRLEVIKYLKDFS